MLVVARERAKERQREAGQTHGRGQDRSGQDCPDLSPRRARDDVAAIVPGRPSERVRQTAQASPRRAARSGPAPNGAEPAPPASSGSPAQTSGAHRAREDVAALRTSAQSCAEVGSGQGYPERTTTRRSGPPGWSLLSGLRRTGRPRRHAGEGTAPGPCPARRAGPAVARRPTATASPGNARRRRWRPPLRASRARA